MGGADQMMSQAKAVISGQIGARLEPSGHVAYAGGGASKCRGKGKDGGVPVVWVPCRLKIPVQEGECRVTCQLGLWAFDFEPGAIVGVDSRPLCCGWLMRPVMLKNWHPRDE